MSRGHVQGYDSNAAQFARMGNPWITAREQQELGEARGSRGQMRRNRKPRPCSLPYAEVKSIARALTPEEEKAKQQREMLNHVLRLGKALRGSPVRETTGYPVKERPVATVRPAALEELGEWNRDRIEGEIARLERCATAARIAAKEKLGDYRAAAELALGGSLAL
jgi:hypothetical protein